MRRLIILALVMAGVSAFADAGTLVSPTGDVYEVEFRFHADELPKGEPAIAPELPALLQSGDFSCAWRRGDWAKNYEGTNVAEASSYVPSASDYEHWLKFSVMNGGLPVLTREVFFSKLPVCYMTTDDGEFPSAQKEKHNGWLRIQGNADFKEQYDGAMTVNVRGNTSAGYPKKPYKVKLDKKASPFGLGSVKSKHWVLLANMPDMSNMRNKLAYDFAASIGVKGMKSTWVEVVLNGRYDGLYQFCEQIRVAKDRVNVFDWEGYSEDSGYTAEDLSWIDPSGIDVNGGWLFEFSTEMDEVSRFTVRSGNLEMKTMVNSPERWHAAQGSMYCEWLSDYRFARRARARYRQIRDAYAELAANGGTIDQYAAFLRESDEANDARWPQNRTFAQDVSILKNFIAGHKAWLDEQFASVAGLLESVRCDVQTSPWDGTIPADGTSVILR